MTFAKFNRLYESYKQVFDNELTLKLKGITYRQIDEQVEDDAKLWDDGRIDDVIPF